MQKLPGKSWAGMEAEIEEAGQGKLMRWLRLVKMLDTRAQRPEFDP